MERDQAPLRFEGLAPCIIGLLRPPLRQQLTRRGADSTKCDRSIHRLVISRSPS
jgi:hypothetical protein